jgi:hypothetical protein
MARRSEPPELITRVSFEAARIAPQCLAEAYERLVPIPRRPTRSTITGEPLSGLAGAADQPYAGGLNVDRIIAALYARVERRSGARQHGSQPTRGPAGTGQS